jgi:hypothetical protein
MHDLGRWRGGYGLVCRNRRSARGLGGVLLTIATPAAPAAAAAFTPLLAAGDRRYRRGRLGDCLGRRRERLGFRFARLARLAFGLCLPVASLARLARFARLAWFASLARFACLARLALIARFARFARLACLPRLATFARLVPRLATLLARIAVAS